MTSRGGEKVLSLRFNNDQSIFTLRLRLYDCQVSFNRVVIWTKLLGCFTCCTDSGVRIHHVEPLTEKAHYGIGHFYLNFLEIIDSSLLLFQRPDIAEMGSVISCEMLHRTNLIAIVGGGSRPKFADNTILIYDDVLKTFVLEYTFTTPVLAVRLKRDRQKEGWQARQTKNKWFN